MAQERERTFSYLCCEFSKASSKRNFALNVDMFGKQDSTE